MSEDTAKLQAFLDLVNENPDNLFADHWQSLTELLQNQFKDDDEKNFTIIETWLKESTRTAILEAYKGRSRPSNPLLNATGEKGGYRTKATSGEASPSYRELIEQAVKKNTPQSDSSNSKPPEKS